MRVRWRSFYAVTLITLCLLLGSLETAIAFSARSRSISNTTFFGLTALFFWYVAAVLVFQSIQTRKYQRAIDALGFVPLDWKDVPFNDALPAIFQYRKKAFLSHVVHGKAGGSHVYLFNRASDVAWWSKKKTTIVFEHSQNQNSDDDVKRRLSERGDADLAFYDHWCMIQARHEIEATALPEWLQTVIGITKHA
jgi:hypothetical protein